MINLKSMDQLISRYRRSINPPHNFKDYLNLFFTFLILLALPVGIYLAKQQQDLRNRAQEEGPQVKNAETPPQVESVPDEILMKFKEGVDENGKDTIRNEQAATKSGEIKQIGVEKLKVKPEVRDKIIEALSHNPAVQYAEPNYLVKMQINPNDPALPNESNLSLINASSGWNVATGSAQIIIAILDTGIATSHPDLQNQYGGNQGIDDNGHGTQVAGLAAAFTNNATGIASLCWSCKLLSIKVLDSTGSGSDSAVAAGITQAADMGAKVINLSLGGYATTQTMQDAINYAWNKGIVIVGAAGNDNTSIPFYPAAGNNVIAVGATDSTNQKATFSNFGPWVDVVAPGVSVGTTVMSGAYAAASGTSMSAPQVSALAGLILSVKPGLTNQQVVDIITSTAKDLGTSGKDDTFGFGLIDAGAALSIATGATPQPTSVPSPSPTLIPVLPLTPTAIPVSTSSDRTSPLVSITNPLNGATVKVNSKVTLTANASDNVGIYKVEFYVAGTLKCTDFVSPYTCPWSVPGKKGTSYAIQAKAYDASSNTQSANITVKAQ